MKPEYFLINHIIYKNGRRGLTTKESARRLTSTEMEKADTDLNQIQIKHLCLDFNK